MPDQTLRHFIENVLEWPFDRVDVHELKAGKHNRRFKLKFGSELLSARWNGKPSHGGIQRSSEFEAHRYAAEQGIAPPLRYVDDQWLVHDFVAGRVLTTGELKNDQTLNRLVDAIGLLRHGPQLVDRVDPVALVREFTETASIRQDFLPVKFQEALDLFEHIADRVADAAELVMSHGDLWLDNIIWDGRRIWLLDWECAGMSHPYRDLAKICISGNIESSRRYGVLSRYCQSSTANATLVLDDLIQTELLLHVSWCLAHGESKNRKAHHDAGPWLDQFFEERKRIA